MEGQCGVLDAKCDKTQEIKGIPEIVSVVAGEMHSVFLDIFGCVWTCGSSTYGQSGHGLDIEVRIPKMLHLSDKIVSAAAGRTHTLLLTGA